MKKILSVVSILAIIAIIFSSAIILTTTKNIDEIKADFLTQSKSNSTNFIQSDFLSGNDWDYVTYVSESANDSTSEMYLIRNTDFLFLNHLNRFKIIKHFVGANAVINYDYLDLAIKNQNKSVFFLYSSNNSHISKIKCEFSGLSGNTQYEELGVSYNMPFAIDVILREDNMKLTAIECADANGDIVFSHGDFVTI